jgi:hypothetical protein
MHKKGGGKKAVQADVSLYIIKKYRRIPLKKRCREVVQAKIKESDAKRAKVSPAFFTSYSKGGLHREQGVYLPTASPRRIAILDWRKYEQNSL